MSPIKMHTRYGLRPVDGLLPFFADKLTRRANSKHAPTYKTQEDALKDRNWRLGSVVRDAGGYPDMLETYEILTFSPTLWTRVKTAWPRVWDEEEPAHTTNLGVLAMLGVLVGLVTGITAGIGLLIGAVTFSWVGLGLALVFPLLAIGADAIGVISSLMWFLPEKEEKPFTAEGMFAGMMNLKL